MLKFNKNSRKVIIDFFIIIAIWISAVFIWDILTRFNPNIEGEIPKHISVAEINKLNLVLAGLFLGSIFGILNIFIKSNKNIFEKNHMGELFSFIVSFILY